MPEENVEAISHAPTDVVKLMPAREEDDPIEEECICWDGIPRVITSAR